MAAPPPPKNENLTFEQRLNVARWFIQWPALSVMVFLRKDIGYRRLSPFRLVGVAVFLTLIAGVVQDPDKRPMDLFAFAILMLITGLCQRFMRWRQIGEGVLQHSYYIGSSHFELPWMPAFMRSRRRIAGFLDPLICAAFGFFLFPVTPLLGCWLLISAICLRCYEYDFYRHYLHRQLDTVDGLIESEIQSDSVEHFVPPTGQNPQNNDSSIPTGLGNDIQKKIKSKKPDSTREP